MASTVYEYLNRSTDSTPETTGADRRSWIDPSVCAGDDGNELVKRLLDAERYPGEAFETVLEPSPETIMPAFIADAAVRSDDVVGFASPSTQLCDDLFFSVYATMAETGAVLTTKYPRSGVHSRLPTLDPFVVDATPGAQTDGGVDVSKASPEPVRCGDLTSLGVAAERATTRLAAGEATGTFAIATMTQLLAHHDTCALDRFLHELVGQWRNHGVGGLVHVPPAGDVDHLDWFGSAHFDYVIEIRTGDNGIEARVVGKRDVAPTWRTVRSTPRSDIARPNNASDRQPSEPVEKEDGASIADRGA